MECQSVDLGSEAKSYMASRLHDGLYLAHSLAAVQNLEAGIVRTYIDPSTDLALLQGLTAEQMNTGGIIGLQYPSACPSKFIRDFLAGDKDRLCIFENYNASPTPVWLSRFRSHALVHGQEVYNIVCNSQATEQHIMEAIQESESGWIFIGCLTTMANAEGLLKETEASERLLDEIAAGAEHIISGAFDSEGYLLWSKPR